MGFKSPALLISVPLYHKGANFASELRSAVTKYENKEFKNVTFVAEECFFVNCVLRECDLFYSGGDFEWVNANFQNCRWHFRGQALRTIQLGQLLGMLKNPQTVPPSPAGKMN